MIVVDVELNQFKALCKSTSNLLRYEAESFIELYYVNKGEVIFRVTILRDEQDKYNLFMQSLPGSIRIFTRIRDNHQELKEIKEEIMETKDVISRIEMSMALKRRL